MGPGRVAAAAGAALALSACALGGGSSAPTTSAPTGSTAPAPSSSPSSASPSPSPTYEVTGPVAWLCRPGLADNPCEGRLDTRVVAPDGSTTVRRFQAPEDPSFDCFYVYPTVSTAPTVNARLESSPEIVRTARAQASPFQSECRLFVPLYRQITLKGLFDGAFSDPEARAIAQRDLVNAFHAYLDTDNEGRPFLLIGHSQGATSLTSLVQSEIDGDPSLRSRMVSALLIGAGPWLAAGSTTQGTFQNIPPCRTAQQAGCVVAYNSYDGAPPRTGLFGRTVAGRTVICVNPGSPSGGSAMLDPVLPRLSAAGDVVGFVEYVGSVRARCRSTSSFTWLDVQRVAGSTLPPPATSGQLGPAWGLHRYDVSLALGDLVPLAASQAAALG